MLATVVEIALVLWNQHGGVQGTLAAQFEVTAFSLLQLKPLLCQHDGRLSKAPFGNDPRPDERTPTLKTRWWHAD